MDLNGNLYKNASNIELFNEVMDMVDKLRIKNI